MAAADPKLIIRLGSHAEKEYLEKTVRFLDGVIVGANLVEATPGATASLLVKCGGQKRQVPLYIDPMTYAFGSYIDPESGVVRHDLDWIKSDQTKRDKKGVKRTVREFKRSYRALASALGDPFESALDRGQAVGVDDFRDAAVTKDVCRRVANYQVGRIQEEFKDDEYAGDMLDRLPVPCAVFTPYFYIEPGAWQRWTTLALTLAATTAKLGLDKPVHAVVCADVGFLRKEEFLEQLERDLPGTGVDGVWFWFSKFNEHEADQATLKRFRLLIERLTEENLAVFNMHGGYFSLCLSKCGLQGTSHGVGYGEQKDVMPVIGQSTPTVRYYLPDIRKKVGVPAIERTFRELGITTPSDFHRQICGCVICKGVVGRSIEDFRQFGEMHRSTPESKRDAQTPAAAKRCRFHFLLDRIKERDQLGSMGIGDIAASLSAAAHKWGEFPTVSPEAEHLQRWADVLRPK